LSKRWARSVIPRAWWCGRFDGGRAADGGSGDGAAAASWRWLSFWQNEEDEAIMRQLRASPDGGYVVSPVRCYVPEAILERAASFERCGVLYRIVW
jgi:hypothetical protein